MYIVVVRFLLHRSVYFSECVVYNVSALCTSNSPLLFFIVGYSLLNLFLGYPGSTTGLCP